MFDSHGIIIEEISLFTKMFQNLEIYTMDYDDSKESTNVSLTLTNLEL